MKRKVQLAFILLTISYALTEDHLYCSIETCPNRTHTLCKHPDQNITHPRCTIPVHFGMRYREIEYLLNLYNINRPERRYGQSQNFELQHEPTLLPMDYKMYWDDELAEIAQRWANQCIDQTDECRNVDRFLVTQRVGIVRSFRHEREPSVYTLITRWSEADNLSAGDLLNLQDLLRLEHLHVMRMNAFRQLLRQIHNRVGCGAVRSKDYWFQYVYLVCNFGTA